MRNIRAPSKCTAVTIGIQSMIKRYRVYIPTVGRLLMIMTFVDDGIRLMKEWGSQVDYLAFSTIFSICPRFIRISYVLFSISAQIIGPLFLLFNKKIVFSCNLLLSYMFSIILVYGFSLPPNIHHQGRARFVIRSLALAGGLLMLIANKKWKSFEEEKYRYSAGLISIGDPCKILSWLQLAGRILLGLLCFQFFEPWHGWLYAISCSLTSVSVLVGFKAEVGTLILAVLITVNNFVVNDFWQTSDNLDALLYFFFQDMSILGALFLLASLGPGGISLDGKKKY